MAVWRNKEVQEKLKEKREANKVWDTTRDNAIKMASKTAKKKQETRRMSTEQLYKTLETKKGETGLFKTL